MQVEHVYPVAAAGGAPLVVRCTMVTTRMEIRESVLTNATEQGLIYQPLTPTQFSSFIVGPTIDVPPNFEPIVFAGHQNDHAPHKEPIGNGGSAPFPVGPGGPATRGTVICQVTSATATPTSISVTEWN